MSTPAIIRLNKFISNSGICNRRQADDYISQGRVTVNDRIINKLGSKVSLNDQVKFDGKEVSLLKVQYIILNKPKGFHCITSNANSKTIFSLLSSLELKGIKSIDFLKENYTGLLLLSNDNEFVNKINAKKKSITQIFHIKLDQYFSQKDFYLIKDFKISDKLVIKSINYVDGGEKNELGLELFMDSIKDLEKLFSQFNYKIISCDRVLFSSLTKKDLPRGKWRNLSKQELINLYNFNSN
tara:strand:- start:4903 stop:5622 length:720 start_codon:yes stop_codon:yes gene_type:complete